MPRYITRLTNAVLLTALFSGTGIAAARPAQDGPQAAGGGGPEIESNCIGIDKTAERYWVLYDSSPKPFLLLPLIHSVSQTVGRIVPGQQFTVCKQINRSTWNYRWTWLQVRVNSGSGDVQSGWISMIRDDEDSWLLQP